MIGDGEYGGRGKGEGELVVVMGLEAGEGKCSVAVGERGGRWG